MRHWNIPPQKKTKKITAFRKFNSTYFCCYKKMVYFACKNSVFLSYILSLHAKCVIYNSTYSGTLFSWEPNSTYYGFT